MPRHVPASVTELQRIGLFGSLPGETIGKLAQRMVREDIPGGRMIVSEGEATDRFYVLLSGIAAVSQARSRSPTRDPPRRHIRGSRTAAGCRAHGDGDGDDRLCRRELRPGDIRRDPSSPLRRRRGAGLKEATPCRPQPNPPGAGLTRARHASPLRSRRRPRKLEDDRVGKARPRLLRPRVELARGQARTRAPTMGSTHRNVPLPPK